jgi:tRNA(Ile)-lysidine synthase
VVTVDHGIRAPEESAGDADFVAAYCKTLGVECVIRRLGAGTVRDCAAERGRGIEDAARHLRYGLFAEESARAGGACVLLAHTQNDHLETVLYRFLQGSASASGVKRQRGIFVRPLLDVGRAEVESYLAALGVAYRTDSTNADTALLRNRVRHRLVPLLNAEFPGWHKALLAGADKAADDAELIVSVTDNSKCWEEARENGAAGVRMSAVDFCALPRAVRRELLYRACDLLGGAARLPYQLVARFIDALPAAGALRLTVGALVLERDAVTVRVYRAIGTTGNGETAGGGFFTLIDSCGDYRFPFGVVRVCNDGAGYPIALPFCVRSRLPCDTVSAHDGNARTVTSFLSGIGVPERLRDRIPLVESYGEDKPEIVLVAASVAGSSFKDWVKRAVCGNECRTPQPAFVTFVSGGVTPEDAPALSTAQPAGAPDYIGSFAGRED